MTSTHKSQYFPSTAAAAAAATAAEETRHSEKFELVLCSHKPPRVQEVARHNSMVYITFIFGAVIYILVS
jgi:hypothetical protein